MKKREPEKSDPLSRKPSRPRALKTPKPPPYAEPVEAAAPVKKPAAKKKRTVKPKEEALEIPPILLEGDGSPTPPASGPGRRFVLGAVPAPASAPVPAAELPDGYGTLQLFLTARDPRWLYAYWDFTAAQLKKFNGLSAHGHLILRVYPGSLGGEAISEIHVHPESRNWFVPVPRAGAEYLSAIGYYDAARHWVTLSVSGATFTPPDALSDETTVRFATIPHDVPFAQLLSIIKGAVREHAPLVKALQQLRAQGHKGLPEPEQIKRDWTPAQEKALAEIVSMDQVRRIWVGSLEITELVRRRLQHDVSSITAAEFSLPSSPMGASVSSPFGGAARPRGFWFNVNAELIIYGSTEPDATVTIADRQIKLRSDGSFTFRFALPDGQYSLPAAATSADGEETREAHLRFKRGTIYKGDVGAHPQDERLKPPVAAAVA